MKHVWRAIDSAVDIASMLAFGYCAQAVLGNWLGLAAGIAFMVLLNAARRRRAPQGPDVIKLPGTFRVISDDMMSMVVNGRQLVLNKHESVEIKVPKSCGGAVFNFIDKPEFSDDDILSSGLIGEK